MRLYDVLGPAWALLGPEPLADAARGGSVTVVTLHGDGDAMLVRPDGHLAWRGSDEAGLRRMARPCTRHSRRGPDPVTDDDWRARKKAATKQSIQEHALRLFNEKGYDATTVEEIAAAAGVSHMTFFRYFPRKEAVVEYDEYDPDRGLDRGATAGGAPLVAVHRAIRVGLDQVLVETTARPCSSQHGLILHNPELRSRNLVAQDTTRDLFARALARRAGLATPDLRGHRPGVRRAGGDRSGGHGVGAE